jgi:hypothetical protein
LVTTAAGQTNPGMSMTPPPDPNISLLRLEDSIASLRTGLMFVGVIAVAALGVAIYALLGDSSQGAVSSDARVSQLEDRVDRLSQQPENPSAGAGGSDVAGLGERVDALERTVKTLADRPSTDATQAIEQLSGRLDELSAEVEQLKQAETTP